MAVKHWFGISDGWEEGGGGGWWWGLTITFIFICLGSCLSHARPNKMIIITISYVYLIICWGRRTPETPEVALTGLQACPEIPCKIASFID